jgi:CheY-like chemotaxis protein
MNTPPKILVVDDSAVILKAFDAKLTAAGLSVILSREALAAVGLARVEKPDLIILDINFPPEVGFSSLQWDGLSVLQWFKRYEDVAAIPILVMSSDAPEACEKKVLAGGAAAFLHKPVDFDQLLAAIPRVLAAK